MPAGIAAELVAVAALEGIRALVAMSDRAQGGEVFTEEDVQAVFDEVRARILRNAAWREAAIARRRAELDAEEIPPQPQELAPMKRGSKRGQNPEE